MGLYADEAQSRLFGSRDPFGPEDFRKTKPSFSLGPPRIARHPSPARIYNRVADILIIFLSHFGCFDFALLKPPQSKFAALAHRAEQDLF